MKKLFLLAIFLNWILSDAQIAGLTTHNIVKDSIVAKFNRDDYKGIYAMADSGFKANITEEQIVGLLKSAGTLGKIMSSEFITADTAGVSYRLLYSKKSLQLNLAVQSVSSYCSFGLSFYKLPVVRTRTNFLSDNPLNSHLDSVVQQAVTNYMSNKNVAGLSVGVLSYGKMYTYNFGETEKGNGQLPTANAIYEIGSVTKTFTGMLLARAVLEGRVRLDDDIRKYLGGSYPNLEYEGQPIRLVHLSNHTSGLPAMPKIPGTNEDPFSPSIKFTDEMLTNILHHVTLDTVPGTRKSYSNFAVGLMGLILEKVYGMSYAQLLKKYILSPYAMRDSKTAFTKADYKHYAQGYGLEGNTTAYWYNRLAEPAGGIYSTMHDMLLYMQQQLNANDSAAWLSHQLTFGDVNDGTGLNWGIYTTKAHHLRWSHDGGTDGFTSLCLIYPQLKAGIILLTNNGDHDDNSFYDIYRAIYNSWVVNPHP